jgi:hypothetical protein
MKHSFFYLLIPNFSELSDQAGLLLLVFKIAKINGRLFTQFKMQQIKKTTISVDNMA